MRVDLLYVSERVVETPGEVEREEAKHECCQDDNDHLHGFLSGLAGRQVPPLGSGSPADLQELPHHQPVTHHDDHEGQGEHEDGYDRTVHQEVIKKLRAGGVVADPGGVLIPNQERPRKKRKYGGEFLL